jgi:cell division protein FtsB
VRAVAEARRVPRSRTRFTPRAILLALVVTALLFYLAVPLRTYFDQRNRLQELERRSQVLEQQNDELRKQIELLHDPAYLEMIARACLGMVKEGEIGFIVVPEGGKSQPPDC